MEQRIATLAHVASVFWVEILPRPLDLLLAPSLTAPITLISKVRHGIPLMQALRAHPAAQLFSSPLLLEELTDVLTRPAATKRLAVVGKSPREVLADYLDANDLVEPVDSPRVARDPDDDQVLACALAAKASLIVSGDRDLLELGTVRDIRILTAAQALAVLGR